MTLAPGQRLGPYEIAAKLGEGGMGEVYRATDTQLDRQVAIKVLPAEFTEDKERLARFEREAKLLAQLHHPNIASIFGLEESDGTRALVMELVEGPTLAERLEQGPLPFSDCLSVSLQIAQALEEAHEKGIVHRDLKPQNIKASIEGKVKVLDFGLAKAMDPAVGSAASAADLARSPTLLNSPTLTAVHGTQLGVILGTAAYMAPEQAKGLPIDKRADIWAFGVVLYEMLAGRSLFAGDTVTDTLAGVLKGEIDFTRLPATTPVAVRQLLRRCLERNPKNRLHDIADARIVLDELARGGGVDPQLSLPSTTSRARSARELAAWALAALATLAALALWTGRARFPGGAVGGVHRTALTRFAISADDGGSIQGFPALSPDGRTLVYALEPESGAAALWAHSFESGTSRKLAGTEGGDQPFLSPDGRQLGFFADGQLKRLDLATGLAQNLARVADPRGGTWTAEGDVLLSVSSSSPIERFSQRTGELRSVTEVAPDRGEQSHRYPFALPGAAFLFTVTGATESQGVYWTARDSATPRRILKDASRAVYDGRGLLLWVRENVLVAQPFVAETGELAGEPLPVAEGVGRDAQRFSETWFAASAVGTMAFRRGAGEVTELAWVDRRGAPLGAVTAPGKFREPALSPDGRQVVVGMTAVTSQSGDGDWNLWIFDTAGRDIGRRLTFNQGETAIWSPDGRWIAYSSARGSAGYTLFRKAADGASEEEKLFESGVGSWIDSWSADGGALLFERFIPDRGADLWLLPLTGERRPVPFLETEFNEAHSAYSPDDKLLAYVSDENGIAQIFVRTVAAPGSRWQISKSDGDWPAWSADGKELYFVSSDRMLHAVPIADLSPFVFGAPEPLFRLRTPRPAITSNRTYFAVAPDRRRILVNQLVDQASSDRIDVVIGWGLQPEPR